MVDYCYPGVEEPDPLVSILLNVDFHLHPLQTNPEHLVQRKEEGGHCHQVDQVQLQVRLLDENRAIPKLARHIFDKVTIHFFL